MPSTTLCKKNQFIPHVRFYPRGLTTSQEFLKLRFFYLNFKIQAFKKIFSLNVIFLCYLSYLGSSTLSTCELFLSLLLSQEILHIFFLFKCSNKHICHHSFNSSELGFFPFQATCSKFDYLIMCFKTLPKSEMSSFSVLGLL